MHSSIDAHIDRIAAALPILVARLRHHGYQFANPDQVLPGPEATVKDSIQRIEGEIGTVPYALATFWRRVGSVNLCGSHPEWFGCEYPDPLVVEPASLAVAELDEFIADREERLKADFPYLIPIAPDDYHKEDVSGGMWYNVDCPATADDPIINDERHNVTFLTYLDLALALGGFLGLDQADRHSWPVTELNANLISAS